MRIRVIKNVLSAIVILGMSFQASAGAITVGDGWTGFGFGGVGSSFSGQPFTFTLAGNGELKVTDAFLQGDRFEVFDSMGSLGFTSVPVITGANTGDYDIAFADSGWSSGTFSLTAGSYSITGLVTDSPFGSGGAALRVDATVPTPATVALFGLGLVGLGWSRRKKA